MEIAWTPGPYAYDRQEGQIRGQPLAAWREADEAVDRWIVDELVNAPSHDQLQRAFDDWRQIVDGPPRIAREQFAWSGEGAATVGSAAWA